MIRFNDGLALARIAEMSGNPPLTMGALCIANYDDDGALEGGMIFDQFNGQTVFCHIAGLHDRWFTPAFAFATSDFAFTHLKAKKVLGIMRSGNEHALEFAQKSGFAVENVLRDFFPSGDAYLVSLVEEDCPYLADRYRKRYDRERLKMAAAKAA